MARAPRIPGLSYIPVEEDDDDGYLITQIGFRVVKIPASVRYGNNRRVTEFKILSLISEGRFGIVYKVQDSRDDQIYALKKLLLPECHADNPEPAPQSYLRQINNLKTLKHLNIVNLKEVVVGKRIDCNYLLLEYCEYSLKNVIEQVDMVFFQHQHVKNIMLQLLFGLEHLHRFYVLHRDLCPKNILFTGTGILKISDFGSSRVASEGDMTPHRGVKWYRAPEILFGSTKYTKACDIWSVGCMFGEMIRQKPLLCGKSDGDVVKALIDLLGSPSEGHWPGFSQLPIPCCYHLPTSIHNRIGELFSNQSFNTVEYLKRFLKYNPASRPSAADLMHDPYYEEHPLCCTSEALMYPLRLTKKTG